MFHLFRIKKAGPLYLTLVTAAVLFACTQSQKDLPSQNVVAQVEDERITLGQLRIAYTLDPAFPSYKKGRKGLREYVTELLDKILAAKRAQQEGLDRRNPFARELNYKRREAAIRQFYVSKVKNAIRVSESELRNAFAKMSRRLQVKHLFFSSGQEARRVYKELEAGADFDSLARRIFPEYDPQTGRPANLGLVNWGELEEPLEQAAWALSPGRVSQPVQSRFGFHLLKVEAAYYNFIPNEAVFASMRSQIKKKLLRRKERQAAGAYLKKLLEPLDIRVKSGTFLIVAEKLGLDSEGRNRHTFTERYLTDDYLDILANLNDKLLQRSFMESHDQNWTVGDFVQRLEILPPEKRPRISSINRFKEDVGRMIRDDFLFEMAVQHNYHQTAYADSVVLAYLRERAYNYYLGKAYKTFVLPSDVEEYYKQTGKTGSSAAKPSSVLPGMISPDHYKLYYAARELHTDLLQHNPRVQIILNDSLITAEAKKIEWEHPIRMFVPARF